MTEEERLMMMAASVSNGCHFCENTRVWLQITVQGTEVLTTRYVQQRTEESSHGEIEKGIYSCCEKMSK